MFALFDEELAGGRIDRRPGEDIDRGQDEHRRGHGRDQPFPLEDEHPEVEEG